MQLTQTSECRISGGYKKRVVRYTHNPFLTYHLKELIQLEATNQ